MKQILLSIILTLTCLQSHAQNIAGIHTLRIGDKVEKQLVEYELNDESAKNVVWDLRDLPDLDGKHKVVYTDVESWGRFWSEPQSLDILNTTAHLELSPVLYWAHSI